MRLNSLKRKIKGFFYAHRTSLMVVFLVLIISLAAILTLFYGNFSIKSDITRNSTTTTKSTTTTTKDPRVPAPLTGLLVDPDKANRRALAVVIENHPDARPQSGYPNADIVYETLAEGGITRTLAVYSSQDCNEIGPVRSARSYFIDWLKEWNAIFVHVGGNIDALDRIYSEQIPDLNQFYWGNYFWRSTARYAPHNVYTTTEKLYAATAKAGHSVTGVSEGYKFKTDIPKSERPLSQAIGINFSTALFKVVYDYNQENNNYLRSVGGVKHIDKTTGVQLTAKNIVVMYQTVGYGVTRIGEQKVNIGTTGSGKAIVFLDGKFISATWSKASSGADTKILDENGQEVKFNPGQTWFEVVPVGSEITY